MEDKSVKREVGQRFLLLSTYNCRGLLGVFGVCGAVALLGFGFGLWCCWSRVFFGLLGPLFASARLGEGKVVSDVVVSLNKVGVAEALGLLGCWSLECHVF